MDYTWVRQVVQLTDIAQVQEHVGAGWVILSIANGQHPDLSAYQLFALGKYEPDNRPLRGEGDRKSVV